MNGDKNYILDTNILIYYFEGKISLDDIFKTATFIGISIVSYIEFLGYNKLSKEDIFKFHSFVKLITVIELPNLKTHSDFYDLIISNKRKYNIKPPAIVFGFSGQSVNHQKNAMAAKSGQELKNKIYRLFLMRC